MITLIYSSRFPTESVHERYLRLKASHYINSASGFLDSLLGDIFALAKDYHCSKEMRSDGQITPDHLQQKCITALQERLKKGLSFRSIQAALLSHSGHTENNDGDLLDILDLAQSDWNDVDTIKALYKRYGEVQWPRWDEDRRKAWDLEKIFQPQD